MTDKDTSKAAVVTAEKPEEEAVVADVKTTKKKNKRNVPQGQVHIKATFNNTIVTVTDNKGQLLTASSAGANGFRGSKKGTAYAAQVASEKALTGAKNMFGMSKADVFVKGVGLGRDAAIRAMMNVDMTVESITDVTPIAHGGCRPKKAKKG